MSTDKKRILVCIDWYEPGFKAGGPIRSVANMVHALKSDFDFYILTSAYDLGEEKPYDNIPLNQWYDDNGVFIRYMDRRAISMSSVKGNVEEINPDILYLNSLFSKVFTLAPLIVANRKKIKVVLAPRGMLGQGALEIKKGKKKLFLTLARLTRFYRKVKWHASTIEEEKSIRKVFGKKAIIKVAQNIPISQSKSLDEILDKKNTGVCKFIYLSRIAIVKNLDMAIEAMIKAHPKRQVVFEIYGNKEDQEYFESFQNQIGTYENLDIKYLGVLNPSEVSEKLTNADYMILPTRHENYGHAIVEAWANGCPVIISKNTPWKNLRIKELGWDVDIENPENLTKAIQEAIDIDFTTYISMVRASYHYFAEKICDDSVLEANKKLFQN